MMEKAQEHFKKERLDTLEKQIKGTQKMIQLWKEEKEMWNQKYIYSDAYEQTYRYRQMAQEANVKVSYWTQVLNELMK